LPHWILAPIVNPAPTRVPASARSVTRYTPAGRLIMTTSFPRSAFYVTAATLAVYVDHALAENPAGVGSQAAASAVKSLTVAPGLQISLFACEPIVRNPTDMDIDERGRLWVAEGVNYRSTFQKWGVLQPAGDRIVILEPPAQPGAPVKETVFYQDPSINTALGVCVLGNKAIVSDSPNVFVLTDTDGDGKADQRELLFTGIRGA